jgi:hypothetical protein
MSKKRWRTHAFIPDTQTKEGTPTDHLVAAGNYLAEKQPDVIVVAGDWWDMPSLSAWDSVATKVAEKRQYQDGDSKGDIGYGNWAMQEFLRPIRRRRSYQPEMHFLWGNHEYRIDRFLIENPHLRGAVDPAHLLLDGLQVHPFLEPVHIDGIAYCHYFCLDSNGRVMNSKRGQASAKAQINNVGGSATAGHKQGLDTHVKETPGGRQRGIIAGSFYQHREDWLSPQGNSHWQGILLKHEVRDGNFDLMEVSLDFLRRNYK